jgi:poly(3-hydroxybutyrate) depolymerase
LTAAGAYCGLSRSALSNQFLIEIHYSWGAAMNDREPDDSESRFAACDLVRAASPHQGPWPRISEWHGGADPVVKPENADQIVKQWTDVHGLNDEPTLTETVAGFPRQVWRNRAGDNVIESYTIPSKDSPS